MHIVNVEKPVGVVVAFGGQTAINLTNFLDSQGIKILGTSAKSIDIAEDRQKFDSLLEQFHIKRPKGAAVLTKEDALAVAEKLSYPVLLRPSYVIGGQNMTIARTKDDVAQYMDIILSGNRENSVLIDKYMEGPELEVDVISDGEDVLIPGIMEHIERAGVHSGDSIAVYPPYNLNDKMRERIIDCSTQLALSLKTKGLVNIQYLIYHGELYVIEANPRASRTIPYISKVTGVPMVDIASRVMLGEKLKNMPYGTGLYHIPPYYAAKVPVFSFEKLSDVNSILGPEMKSTGEVLGIGTTTSEALFKGLCAAGLHIKTPSPNNTVGVLISVEAHDNIEVLSLAKKFVDLGIQLYATEDTSQVISNIGLPVKTVDSMTQSNKIFQLMEEGKISYIVYTGALYDSTMGDYLVLHKKALQLGIACFTSLDTAHAVADIIASRYNENNTELIDINHMRTKKQKIHFAKMQGTGNDYIYIENFDQSISCPESLAVTLCNRHYSIGADGIVLIERSEVADAKMRIFNIDGSEGEMAGNSIRCVAKYLYDKRICVKPSVKIETAGGIKI